MYSGTLKIAIRMHATCVFWLPLFRKAANTWNESHNVLKSVSIFVKQSGHLKMLEMDKPIVVLASWLGHWAAALAGCIGFQDSHVFSYCSKAFHRFSKLFIAFHDFKRFPLTVIFYFHIPKDLVGFTSISFHKASEPSSNQRDDLLPL